MKPRHATNAFAYRAAPASYIDVIPSGAGRCGFVPEVCLANFDRYGMDKSSDDFFQLLDSMAQSSPSGLRLVSAINLLDARSYYFVDLQAPASAGPQRNQIISGCALQINTKNQTIYQIVSSSSSEAR